MRIALLVPAPLHAVSGANAYDRALLEGLRAAGHEAEAIELAGDRPPADAAAFDALAADVLPVIDGRGLDAFRDCAAAVAARRTAGLIHSPAGHSLLPRLARIIVTSHSAAGRIAACPGVDARRIAVVEPGIAAAPRSPGSGQAHCAILAVGALVPRQGHDVLLRALAKLFDLDWHLTIVGDAGRDPVHAHALAALAEQLGIARRVNFAGCADPATLESLWQGADIFALASAEGYGMAIAEALRRGVPPAITAGTDAGTLVTPTSGVVCAPGDEVTLSKSLRRLIFDRGLRQATADAAWAEGRALPDWTAQARAFAQALAG